MKKALLLNMILLCGVSFAGFENWTNKAGKEAELELTKVTEAGGEKVGEFKTRAGKTVTLKASDLSEADAKRLGEFKSPTEAKAAGASVFDKILDGNLVALDGERLKKFEFSAKPTKYYLFYYTKYYCDPCRRFTPTLIEFYKTHKSESGEFEIVQISSDDDEKTMEKNAAEKKIPWPQLKLSQCEKFTKNFSHPGTQGVPNLVLTDLEGKVLKSSFNSDGTAAYGHDAVLTHLESLLGK